MEIRLRRKISVSCVRVIGKIAFPEKRVVEHAVVLWAAERLSSGAPVKAEELTSAEAKGPLSGMPPIVGKRLTRVCSDLGLLRVQRDEIVALTSEGERLSATDEPRVFVPQLGTWQVYWSDDPLLPHPILRVDPWQEPSAHNEREQRKNQRDQPKRQFVRVPGLVLAQRDPGADKPPLSSPSMADGRPLRVVEVEEMGEPDPTRADVSVTLVAAPGAPISMVRMVGKIGQAKIDGPLPAPRVPSDHMTLWTSLLRWQGQAEAWNASTGALRLPFAVLKDSARAAFRIAIPFKAPRVGPLGDFDDTRVEEVPLEAASAKDAQAWFRWLLERSAEPAPLWPEAFARAAQEERAKFPAFPVAVPTQADLARSLRGQDPPPPAYWHLQAPLDLDGGFS